MKKRFGILLGIGLLCSSLLPATAFGAQEIAPWKQAAIQSAQDYGFMSGMGNGDFGIGSTTKRAEFASMLVRMLGWQTATPAAGSFEDNTDTSKWYFSAVETLLQHGVVDKSATFRPEENITREELAVMLIKAMGYSELAESVNSLPISFQDVTENRGYILLAYDFGIISGNSPTAFAPKATAKREEVAAMMVRAYEKLQSRQNFMHGFYAFSSFGQIDQTAATMDAVSLGWSRMEYTADGAVTLNTTAANGNEWKVPKGYETAVEELEAKDILLYLDVYMSDSEPSHDGTTKPCSNMLSDADARTAAVNAILEELTVDYKATGRNFYDGVTIDFENLKGAETRANFVSFLQELKTGLDGIGKGLFVTVQPKLLRSSSYFDGYDFAQIGALSDKMIIMAHDYAPSSIPADVQAMGFTTTPVTPFDEVYYALKTVVTEAGVKKDKLVLAMSIDSAGWIKSGGVVTNAVAQSLSPSEIGSLIQGGVTTAYSSKYKNPYLTYTDEEGEHIVWYENAQSIQDKMQLAKLMGMGGFSVWRIGIVPQDSATGMDIWTELQRN